MYKLTDNLLYVLTAFILYVEVSSRTANDEFNYEIFSILFLSFLAPEAVELIASRKPAAPSLLAAL